MAVALASVGLKAFLLPNGFLDGGVTGLALLANRLFDINLSVALLALSVPFLALGWQTLDRRIVVRSVIGIGLLAVALEVEQFDVVTEDKLLIAIFGGLALGLGIGLAIRTGAVLDGSEILGIVVNDRFGVSIGKVILTFNVVLFAVTAAVINLEVALYSILTYLVTAKVIDTVIQGFEDFIGVTIVSARHDALRALLTEELGVGVTLYHAEGGYEASGAPRRQLVIQTIVNRIDIRRLYRVVEEIDAGAFVIEFEVNAVRGGVLRRYLRPRA